MMRFPKDLGNKNYPVHEETVTKKVAEHLLYEHTGKERSVGAHTVAERGEI